MGEWITNLDFAILDWIQSTLKCSFLDSAMPAVSALVNGGLFWILLAIFMVCDKKTRRDSGALAAALILDYIAVNLVLKNVTARVRPYDVNTSVTLLIPALSSYSFPSGHAAASFSCVSALHRRHSGMWVPALIFSLIICFSRLYLYVHYPSDVLGGIVVGIVCGVLGEWLYRRLILREKKAQPSAS